MTIQRMDNTTDHPVRRTSAWRRLAKRTVEAHVAAHGWRCPGWHREPHPVRPGGLAADHPVPLVLGGEPLPARPGVLCASCNARKGLSSPMSTLCHAAGSSRCRCRAW